MSLVISGLVLCLQILFSLAMLGFIGLFLGSLLVTWAWAQHQEEANISLAEILSTAAIEWGGLLTLLLAHFNAPQIHHESPPFPDQSARKQQWPVIFVPSLHLSSGVFSTLAWRLQRHFFTSLWPFRFKTFLRSSVLLEDQLSDYISHVLKETRSKKFHIISFGTSRPIVSRVLSRPEFANACDHWIALSAPQVRGPTLRLLSTVRLHSAYRDSETEGRQPSLLIRGSHDTLCYPEKIWGDQPSLVVSAIGHFSIPLHPATVNRVIEELS